MKTISMCFRISKTLRLTALKTINRYWNPWIFMILSFLAYPSRLADCRLHTRRFSSTTLPSKERHWFVRNRKYGKLSEVSNLKLKRRNNICKSLLTWCKIRIWVISGNLLSLRKQQLQPLWESWVSLQRRWLGRVFRNCNK